MFGAFEHSKELTLGFVAMNYMHLNYARLLVYGIALVPVVLAVGLMLVLFTDMGLPALRIPLKIGQTPHTNPPG